MMSASPEMRLAPPEAFPRPIATTLLLVEDRDQFHSSSSAKEEEEEGCHTPKAEEFKIPIVENCPPAPKKARLTVLPCRRKLQLDLKLVHVRHEETKSFFQMLVPPPSSGRKRKRSSPGED